jgi:hypothetical protein
MGAKTAGELEMSGACYRQQQEKDEEQQYIEQQQRENNNEGNLSRTSQGTTTVRTGTEIIDKSAFQEPLR